MKMYHVTAIINLTNIKHRGIDASYSVGKIKTVWISTEHKLGLAIKHVMVRHKLSIDRIGIVEIDIPKKWITKGHRGLKHTGCRSVPPYMVMNMKRFSNVIRAI